MERVCSVVYGSLRPSLIHLSSIDLLTEASLRQAGFILLSSYKLYSNCLPSWFSLQVISILKLEVLDDPTFRKGSRLIARQRNAVRAQCCAFAPSSPFQVALVVHKSELLHVFIQLKLSHDFFLFWCSLFLSHSSMRCFNGRGQSHAAGCTSTLLTSTLDCRAQHSLSKWFHKSTCLSKF